MSIAFLGRIALGLTLAGAVMVAAQALTLPELQRLLQTTSVTVVSFQEVRESPWLAAPVESRGTMHSNPDRLEKRVEAPRKETWRLFPDRIEWVGPDGFMTKQIPFSEAPALAALANALRRIVAGDLLALEQDFRIELDGAAPLWTIVLRPRSSEVARHLDHLELRGSGAQLEVIVVVEREGERTTTHLSP
ncbi:MAG: LolA-related protein [Thiobacillus sp.]